MCSRERCCRNCHAAIVPMRGPTARSRRRGPRCTESGTSLREGVPFQRLTSTSSPNHPSSPTNRAPMAFFPDVPKVRYEGPDSKNPLAFRHYNADELVDGKPMKDHLRFAVCYWHTFRGTGSD